MASAAPGSPTGPRAIASLERLAQADATVAPLALLQALALREAALPVWEEAVPALEPRRIGEGLPLLHEQTLAIDGGRLKDYALALAKRIQETAATGSGAPAGTLRRALQTEQLDLPATLEASIGQAGEALDGLAGSAGVDFELFTTFAQLLAAPLLQACGRKAAPLLVEAKWDAGYCPVCAAWPVLAESRGLERQRWLRCGRCAAEWTYYLHKCVFCGNSDFHTLGYLAPEAEREARQAATCDDCHGYLKTVSTVGALSPGEVGIQDITTLELDVAALDAGYGRPERPGFPLHVYLEVTRGGGWLPWRR